MTHLNFTSASNISFQNRMVLIYITKTHLTIQFFTSTSSNLCFWHGKIVTFVHRVDFQDMYALDFANFDHPHNMIYRIYLPFHSPLSTYYPYSMKLTDFSREKSKTHLCSTSQISWVTPHSKLNSLTLRLLRKTKIQEALLSWNLE